MTRAWITLLVLSTPVAADDAVGVAAAPADATDDWQWPKGNETLQGGLFPKVWPDSWQVWTPPAGFGDTFAGWRDDVVPSELVAWCNAFIPMTNSTGAKTVGPQKIPVVPLDLPLGVPVPGYWGQCAVIDGRSWDPADVFEGGRPKASRFAGFLKVTNQDNVESGATCGISHNICCQEGGCGSVPLGGQTCEEHCPDEDMHVRRVRCWTDVTGWTADGVDCDEAKGTILAVKAYIYGRGGDPCVAPLGVPSPTADWDIGLVLFPTKRRAMVTGYVDDAPATECYARVTEQNGLQATLTLAQMPMPEGSVPQKLVGFSDRPLNPSGDFVDLPRAPSAAKDALSKIIV